MGFFKRLIEEWQADEVTRRAAALAFYTFLALGPLLIILVSLLGLVFGETEARANLLDQAENAVGPTAASALRAILENAGSTRAGVIGMIVGWVLLFITATGVFAELQTSLNKIWGVKKKQVEGKGNDKGGVVHGLAKVLIDRLFAFAGLLVVGLLLLIAVVASSLVSGFAGRLSDVMPAPELILQIAEFLVFMVILIPPIAFLFKVLPNTEIRWKDVWVGAALTAFLFSIGKLGIGLYLGMSSTASSFGAAGAFIVLLLWIYYSAVILLFGAVFTEVYGERRAERRPTVTANTPTYR